MAEDPTAEGRTRRHDPERRTRILLACLDVIAEVGVAGVSHRRVARAADVPLGSMTYHFASKDELLFDALAHFAEEISDRFERRMRAASDADAARGAVADIIREDVFSDGRELVLTHELYTLAARDPRYRQLTSAWMTRSRAALERHFDPLTARLLDAAIEGLSIHRALDAVERDPDDIARAIERIAG
ncbi:TetR family transcriptional regulator [Microbacterium sp. CBS5P-1]|nr:TetR family transcriptional regulator [Microbacterium excoecariae]